MTGANKRLRGPFALGASETAASTSVVTVKANSGLIFTYDGDTAGTGNVVVKLPEQEALSDGVLYESVRFNKYGIATGGNQASSNITDYQADWNATDNTLRTFIRNKPTIPTVTAQSKSKAITVQTPAAGDEVVMLYTVSDAVIATITGSVLGSTSATLRLYMAATLGAGTSGTPLCAAVTIAPADGAKPITVSVSNVPAGNFVYAVVTAVNGTPTLANLNISYTGGD